MSSAHLTKLKRRAAEFEQKKQFDKALALYVQVIDEAGHDIDDADLQLFNRVGDLLTRQSNLSEALAYYEKAVDFYAERGFLNNAIALCNKILRQSPARSAVYYKLGKISASKGFKSDARRNFLEYADRMQQAGNRDEAFRALKEFADLCPDQDDIRLMLADMLTREHRNAEAVEQLQQLYSQLLAEGRENEAHATLERIKAIDPEMLQPMQSGAMPAVKANDLIFLDVETGFAPPPRPPTPTPLSTRIVTPTPPSAVPQARVGALEGLSLTYMPSETPPQTRAVEGLQPTRQTPAAPPELVVPVGDLVVPPRLTPAELQAIDLAVEQEFSAAELISVEPVEGLDIVRRTPAAPPEAGPTLDGLELDSLVEHEQRRSQTPRSTPIIQLAIDSHTALPRLSVTGELLAIVDTTSDLVRTPTPFDLLSLEEAQGGLANLAGAVLDPETEIDAAFAAEDLEEFVDESRFDAELTGELTPSAAEPTPDDESSEDAAHEDQDVLLEFVATDDMPPAPTLDVPAVVELEYLDDDLAVASHDDVIEASHRHADDASRDVVLEPVAADDHADAPIVDIAWPEVVPHVEHAPEADVEWTSAASEQHDTHIESPDAEVLRIEALADDVALDAPTEDRESVAESAVEVAPADAVAELEVSSEALAVGDVDAADKPANVGGSELPGMSSGAFDAAFASLTEEDAVDASADELDVWLEERPVEPNDVTVERVAEAEPVEAWRQDPRENSADSGSNDDWALREPVPETSNDWKLTPSPTEAIGLSAALPPEFALEEFALDDNGALVPPTLPPTTAEVVPVRPAEPQAPLPEVVFSAESMAVEPTTPPWQLPPIDAIELPLLEVNQGSDSLQSSEPLDMDGIDALLSQSPSFSDSGEPDVTFEPAPLDLLGDDTREEWESPEVLIDGEWRDEHVGDLVSGEMFVVGERRDVDRSTRAAFDDLSAAMMYDDDEANDDERPERLPTPSVPSAFSVRAPTPIGTLSFGGLDAQLRRRLELTPDDAGLRRQLGEALLDIGRRDEGIAELDAARMQFEQQGDLSRASDVLLVTLRVIPQSVEHHQKRVEYAVRANDRVRLVDAYIELADALFRSGEPDKSRVVYSRVVELAPNNDRALFALSMLDDTVGPASRSDEIPHIPAGRFDSDPIPSRATFTPGDLAAIRQASEARRTPVDTAGSEVSLGDAVRELMADAATPEALRSIPTPAASTTQAAPAGTPRDVARISAAAPVVAAVPPAAPQPPVPAGDFVDLGDWLREDVPVRSTRMKAADVAPTGDEAADFAEMLRRFKAGVAENVEDEDFASHYDLGVAFKEMGLVDEAIAEFQKSLRGPQHRIRSFEALGQCFSEKEQHEVAVTLLARAANGRLADDDELVGVLYLLAQACEKTGRQSDAVGYYQRVLAVDIHFRDVADRLADLTRTAK